MKKNNVKIKDTITIADDISVIQTIVQYCFADGEYTPYFAEPAKIIAAAQNYLEGVEFEEDDDILKSVMEDDDIYKCVEMFITPSEDEASAKYYKRMEDIMKCAGDIVEFRKQKLIHNSDAFSILGEMCLAVKDILSACIENAGLAKAFMSNLQESGITEETLANALRKAADKFVPATNDIIEAQRERIEEQQKQLQEKEAEIQELTKRRWLNNE